MRLSREIRFALTPEGLDQGKPQNSWAGWPSTNLVVPQLVLRCIIDGEIDPRTGYLCNIKLVDDALRKIVAETLIPNQNLTTAESLLRVAFDELMAQWKHQSNVVSLQLAVSPYLSYLIAANSNLKTEQMPSQEGSPMPTATRISLTEQFEFSAAHRLHCHDLSDAENKELFGKCNNLQGHGHNYVVEVTVSNEVDSNRDQVIGIHEFESTVKRLVIDRLDHKHLNVDIQHFENLNPTVENIVIAIFDWLDGQFNDAKLEKVRLYETPKTWAEHCG